MKNWNIFQVRLDTAAISLSAICLAQCLIVPIAAIIAPTVSLVALEDESFHIMLLLFVLPVSILAMTLGCKKHKTYGVIVYAVAGLSLMALSAVWGHDLFGETGEIGATLVGALILSFAHFKNQKLCKACCH